MLNTIKAYYLFRMVDPIKYTPIAHTKFAQSGKVIGHSHQTPMHCHLGVFRQPKNFAFDTSADGCVKSGQLPLGLRTYLNSVGHGT